MIKNFINWTKNNKFATLVIFVLLVAYFYRNQGYRIGSQDAYENFTEGDVKYALPMSGGGVGKLSRTQAYNPAAPTPEITDRMVVKTGSISLQVKNVTQTVNEIKQKVTSLVGYTVEAYINRPEFGEDATVSVRVPTEKLDEFLVFVRGKAVKVVSEVINGSDITDQYVDTETRLSQLEEQKTMLQGILRTAKTVDEIMKVQPYITQVQNEIDSIKGQIKYMEGTSATSFVTIFLATDEMSLPYQPANSWRPEAIYKSAVRSLVGTLQNIGTIGIWVGVYSVLLVPAIAIATIIYLVIRRKQRLS